MATGTASPVTLDMVYLHTVINSQEAESSFQKYIQPVACKDSTTTTAVYL